MPLSKKKAAKLMRTAKTQRIVRDYLKGKKPKAKIKRSTATKRTLRQAPKPKVKETLLQSAKKLLVDPIKKNVKKGYWNILKDPFGVAKKSEDKKKKL